jgi:hypothetical protein
LIVLLEHQANLSKNFPLRMLLYIGRLYEKILENDNIYRQRLIKIPKPDFIVLYNGSEEYPERAELRLSDAFEDADVPVLLELAVRVYNINQGRNGDILHKSKAFGDYAAFVGRVKENRAKGLSLDKAIAEAVEYCIGNGIMKEYLECNASGVRNMLLTEWNMDDAKRVWRKEALEEGMEKAAESIRMLLKGDRPEIIAERLGLPIEKILRLSERVTKN